LEKPLRVSVIIIVIIAIVFQLQIRGWWRMGGRDGRIGRERESYRTGGVQRTPDPEK
jgi:hypothetical protein